MGLYVVLIATNSNPADATVSEAMQTLLRGAVVAYPPGNLNSNFILIQTGSIDHPTVRDHAT